METFPRAMEAAVLTSSLGLLKRPETVSMSLLTPERSVSLPSSPKHRAPFS
jgi:hypothetical protein